MSSRAVVLIGYLAIGLALLACQIAANRSPARIATFEDVVGAGMRRRSGRLLILLAWWWVGFHFLARSSGLDT